MLIMLKYTLINREKEFLSYTHIKNSKSILILRDKDIYIKIYKNTNCKNMKSLYILNK